MTPLTINEKAGVLHVEVDKTRDLAPQVIVLRSIGLPWKLIEQLCGRPKNRLEEQIAQFADRLEGRDRRAQRYQLKHAQHVADGPPLILPPEVNLDPGGVTVVDRANLPGTAKVHLRQSPAPSTRTRRSG